MNVWMTESEGMMRHVLGNPHNAVETSVVCVAGIVALLLAMKAFTSSAEKGIGWGRRILAAVLLIGIALGTAVAVAHSLAPRVHTEILIKTMLFGIPVLAILIAAIPIMGLILRTRYLSTLIATTAGLVACIAVILVTDAVIDSLRGGNSGFSMVNRRTHTIDDFIGKP